MKPVYTITEIEAPAAEPVTLAELKGFLRLTQTQEAEDAALLAMIKAARMFCENYTGKAFVARRYKAVFEMTGRDMRIDLPRVPVIEVETVTRGEAGVFALEDYSVHAAAGRLVFRHGAPKGQVEVLYGAGFGAVEDVPEAIKQAVLMKATQLYEDRGDVRVTAPFDMIASLLRPYKKIGIA